MTTVQTEPQTTTGMSVVTYEAELFFIRGANHMELNRVVTVAESCGFVDVDLSGWRNFGHREGPIQYIAVFKHGSHVGQHKTRLLELLKETIPGINVAST